MTMRRADGGASVAEIERLYRSHYPRFLRAATAILGGEQRAVDAVHDAFVRAVRHRASFDGRGPLEAWVWRTVVNAALRLRDEDGAWTTFADAPSASTGNGQRDDVEQVRVAVRLLPERQRLALFLRYYADLDYRSSGEVLEMRPGTVAATLSAAHAKIRAHLKEVTRT